MVRYRWVTALRCFHGELKNTINLILGGHYGHNLYENGHTWSVDHLRLPRLMSAEEAFHYAEKDGLKRILGHDD